MTTDHFRTMKAREHCGGCEAGLCDTEHDCKRSSGDDR